MTVNAVRTICGVLPVSPVTRVPIDDRAPLHLVNEPDTAMRAPLGEGANLRLREA